MLRIGEKRGNAVAVSETKALTSLHGYATLLQEVQLFDFRGIRRCGRIIFVQFEENEVDIALIELIDGSFEFYKPVFKGKATLGMDLHVFGRTTSLVGDETLGYYETSKISCVEPTTLVRASYHTQDGMSGAGIIVAEEHGSFHVLGVHVGRGDETVAPPQIKRHKSGAASQESVSENSSATSSNIHGHSSYCLICVAARVENLVALI